MIMSFFVDDIPFTYVPEANQSLAAILGTSALNVAIAILPITAFFFIYQAIAIRLPMKVLIRIISGLVYTYVGLVVFLTAVNIGFLPISCIIGSKIASEGSGLVIVFGAIIGMAAVLLEPPFTCWFHKLKTLRKAQSERARFWRQLRLARESLCLLR
jgi:hypothetical protein